MTRQAYSFLVCPDAELLRRRVEEAAAAAGLAKAERKVFWGDDAEPLPAPFWESLTIKSLFSTPKLLVVRRAQALKAEAWDRLDQALRAVSPDVSVFLCLEGAWDKKAPIPAVLAKRQVWKHAEKVGWVWQHRGLDARTLKAYVLEWAARESLGLEPGALEALVKVLPLDAAALRLELDKIALAAAGDRKVLAAHAALVDASEDMDLFALMDALAKGAPPTTIWRQILGQRADPEGLLFPMIGALAREARLLSLLLSGEEDKARVHPYVKQLKTPLARRLGPSGIARLFDLAMEADLAVKTGERKADQALETLVASLAQTFGRR